MTSITIKINFTGGIVSSGYLLDILEAAREVHLSHVRFGLRQQLIMDVSAKQYKPLLAILREKNIVFEEKKEDYPNIVSSYAGAGIFVQDSWVSEGVYKDVFDLFEHRPKLKINICDQGQTLTPFFTSNINWIASPHLHFWFLFIRFPKTNTVYQWPLLVYTNDIPALSKKIEETILQQKSMFYEKKQADGNKLFNLVNEQLSYISKNAESELVLPSFKLPYYEGFNRQGNKFWLGIYRRDEMFPVTFLIDVCHICIQTKIGQLYTTPWKSIIIKGIEEDSRELWDLVLGKYRINVRHASNELNWQVEDYSSDGLQLKRHIIRYFDKEDVRTYGLCFAIKTLPNSGVFGSVIIRKQPNQHRNKLKSLDRYDILYTADFSPNSKDYMVFRKDVEKEHLSTYLISLCKYYYEFQTEFKTILNKGIREESNEIISPEIEELVYQCSHCLSIYDPASGEPEMSIKAGTSFDQLSEAFSCTVCESPKTDFIKTEKHKLRSEAV